MYSIYQIMFVLILIHDRSYRSMIPAWTTFHVHYFLHSNKHTIVVTVYSNKYCRCCVVPRGERFFLHFFLFESWYISTKCSCLVNYARYVSFSLSLSLLLHTLGSMSVSHCRFMHACIANTSVRCTFGNEHVIKEKKLFFIFFYCKTASQSSNTRLFTPWYIHSLEKKPLYTMMTVLIWCSSMDFSFFSFCLSFSFLFVSFDYSIGVSVVLLLLL
jgi:hypothetical protein